MNLLYFYIFRTFLFPNVVGTLFFTVVFVLFRVGNLVGMCMEKGVPLKTTLELFLYMLPFTAALTIPMGVLFAVLTSIAYLSEHSEITAMRANGFSLLFSYLPCVIYGTVMTIFMFWFMNMVMPEANKRYKTIYRNILYTNPSILLEDRIFTDFPGDHSRMVRKISALKVANKGQVLEDVFLYENVIGENKIKITYADKGMWMNNTINSPFVSLQLGRGRSIEVSYDDMTEMQGLTFHQVQFNIQKNVRDYENKRMGPRELALWEVRSRIKELRRQKKKISPRLWTEYHKKYAIPLACFTFALVAFPLGVTRARGKGLSFVYVIGVIFVYYILITIGESLGRKAYISPILGMHVANIVLSVLGIGIFIWKYKS